MTLESRNARTMRSAQWAYDNAAPDDGYDVRDNLTEDDYAEAREEMIADGWEEPTDQQVEDWAVKSYLAKWSDD